MEYDSEVFKCIKELKKFVELNEDEEEENVENHSSNIVP